MGKPKMSLAWGERTVLGHIVSVFHAAGIKDVLVVTGGDRDTVERLAEACGARTAFNEGYAEEDMLLSLQTGLRSMSVDADACLIALGDQPQILRSTVQDI